MAGADSFLYDGAAGGMPSLTAAPTRGSGIGAGMAAQPHFGVVGLVLVAVAVLWALDKFGFRFAVTAGRR